MTYENPKLSEKAFVLAAWTAIITGIIALPISLLMALATLAYSGFYEGLSQAMLLVTTGVLPISAVASSLFGKRALSGWSEQKISGERILWLCAAWAAIPSSTALWVAVAACA